MVSFMKHPVSVEGEVDIVELEMDKEVTNSSRPPNNEEELLTNNALFLWCMNNFLIVGSP